MTLDASLGRLLGGWFYVAVTVFVFGLWTFNASKQCTLSGVPRNTAGDEPDYDCIACQLRSRAVFAVDYQDSSFLAPYERATAEGLILPGYPEAVAARRPGLTTYRPPLLPILLATTYPEDLPNRSFAPIRVVNLAAAAMTAGLAAWCVRLCVGASASLACLGLIGYAGGLPKYAALILTESLCGFFVTVAWATLCLGLPRRPVASAAVAGVACGLATLTRTSVALWLPAMTCGVWAILRLPRPDGSKVSARRAATAAACFAAVAVALVAPWGLRNVAVLQSLMPLGC